MNIEILAMDASRVMIAQFRRVSTLDLKETRISTVGVGLHL